MKMRWVFILFCIISNSMAVQTELGEVLSVQFLKAKLYGNRELAKKFDVFYPVEVIELNGIERRSDGKYIGRIEKRGAFSSPFKYASFGEKEVNIDKFLKKASLNAITDSLGDPLLAEIGMDLEGTVIVIWQWQVWNGKSDSSIRCTRFTIGLSSKNKRILFRSVSSGYLKK